MEKPALEPSSNSISKPAPESAPAPAPAPASKPALKQRVFDIIHGGLKGSRGAKIFSLIIIALILMGVVSLILESEESVDRRYHSAMFILEVITVSVFTLEYIAGLWTADLAYPNEKHPRLRYMGSFMAVVTLLAVLPFYLGLIFKNGTLLAMTEFFQVLRLLHVLKLSEYNRTLHTFGKVIRESMPQLVTSVVIGLFALLTGAVILYKVEHPVQPQVFSSVLTTLRIVLGELTRTGIGSSMPLTAAGRITAAVMELIIIGIVAVPVGIIAGGMNHYAMSRRQEEQRKETAKFCPWCGHSLEESPDGK